MVVATRQALLLVISLRRRQAEGAAGSEAMIQAAADRLTPSAVTLLVIAAAVLPFAAMGGVDGNEILHPMAVVILGGMVTTALLTLVITPMVYLGLRLRPATPAVARMTPAPRPEVHPQEI